MTFVFATILLVVILPMAPVQAHSLRIIRYSLVDGTLRLILFENCWNTEANVTLRSTNPAGFDCGHPTSMRSYRNCSDPIRSEPECTFTMCRVPERGANEPYTFRIVVPSAEEEVCLVNFDEAIFHGWILDANCKCLS